MNEQRQKRVEELFEKMADSAASEYGQLLESACGEDHQLRDDVLALLQADASGGQEILGFNVTDLARHLLDPERPPIIPGRFGRYIIERLLGHGGMGCVYLAQRDGLGDRVAVKFLHDAWSSPLHRERFAKEQRTLAGLNHPAIARLYDSGVANGIPWFAMEYVEGTRITDFAWSHKLDLRVRLKLFRSVCEAVNYAHHYLTVHLDLKPSNILVTEDGAVKLLDFGIAKNLNRDEGSAEKTQTGLRPFSLNYASPEQIRGEALDIQTDVHGLGIVLYELLTGTTPADLTNAGAAEVLRYTEVEAERPSVAALANSRGKVEASKRDWSDLDVLCLTAIHRERARRYKSVEALIRDVDHYLSGRPLEARPDSLVYRAGKFVRRNRSSLAMVAAMSAVVIGLVVFYTVRLTTSRNAALNAAARTQRIQRFTLRLFQGNDGFASPAENLRVLTLVDRGVEEAQTLKREPEMQAELYQTLGGIYQKLGKFDRADDLFRAALKQREALLGKGHPETVESLIDLGLLRLDQAHFVEAERLIRQGRERLERARSADYEERARATFALGKVLEARGNYPAAIPLLSEAAKIQLAAKAPVPERAATLKELADAQFYAGHFDLCESITRQALDADRQFFGDQHPSVAEALINLGAVQIERGHYATAEQFYRKAVDIDQTWYGENHPQTASAIYMLGEALRNENRFDEAELLLNRALAIQEKVYGPTNPHVANVLNELCIVRSQRNQLREARACYDRVVAIYKNVYGDRHYRVGLALANRASVYLTAKDYHQAERGFRDALAHYREVLPANHLYVGIAQIKLGRTLLHLHRYGEAEEHTLAGYKIVKVQTTPTVSWLQSARADLATIYAQLGRQEEASALRSALAEEAPK